MVPPISSSGQNIHVFIKKSAERGVPATREIIVAGFRRKSASLLLAVAHAVLVFIGKKYNAKRVQISSVKREKLQRRRYSMPEHPIAC